MVVNIPVMDKEGAGVIGAHIMFNFVIQFKTMKFIDIIKFKKVMLFKNAACMMEEFLGSDNSYGTFLHNVHRVRIGVPKFYAIMQMGDN